MRGHCLAIERISVESGVDAPEMVMNVNNHTKNYRE